MVVVVVEVVVVVVDVVVVTSETMVASGVVTNSSYISSSSAIKTYLRRNRQSLRLSVGLQPVARDNIKAGNSTAKLNAAMFGNG